MLENLVKSMNDMFPYANNIPHWDKSLHAVMGMSLYAGGAIAGKIKKINPYLLGFSVSTGLELIWEIFINKQFSHSPQSFGSASSDAYATLIGVCCAASMQYIAERFSKRISEKRDQKLRVNRSKHYYTIEKRKGIGQRYR